MLKMKIVYEGEKFTVCKVSEKVVIILCFKLLRILP